MTFTVTYRGADGALREERIEAANRAECFAQCRARGIAPLSVKEGDFVSRRARKDEGGKTSRVERAERVEGKGKNGRVERVGHVEGRGRVVAYALSVALVALIGGGTWWWMRRDGAAAPVRVRPEAPKKAEAKVSPAQPAKAEPAAAPVPDAPTNRPSVYPTNEHSIVLKRPVVAFSAQTNDEGRVVEHIRTDDGKLHTNIYSLKPPTFESGM